MARAIAFGGREWLLRIARAGAGKQGSEFALQVPTPGFMVYGDPERLIQVFANLLDNAAKYTPAVDHIIIPGYLDGSEVATEVIDDGEGIEPDFLPRIFETFTQRPRTIDRCEGGLGSWTRHLKEHRGGTR